MVSKLAEVEWNFSENTEDWKWCTESANFAHRDACEFIVHIGGNTDVESQYWEDRLDDMVAAGCSNGFILSYLHARDLGAERVLFYA